MIDYSTLVPNNTFPQGVKPWYLKNPGGSDFSREVAIAVADSILDIQRRQWGITEGHRRHARLYAGYLPGALAWGSAPVAGQRTPFEVTRALVRSLCDTATALIVRSRPKSTFVTSGADWKVAQQAEDLDRFTVGAYRQSGIYDVAPRCFHDSTVFGTGLWKYIPRGEGEKFRVCTERVLPDDMIVDEEECREHLEPENTYHRTVVRVDALIRRYAPEDTPEAARLRTRLLSQNEAGHWPTIHVPKDRQVLIEAIHVDPDNPELNRRVLCTPSVVLEDEPWPYPWHPYTVLWWAMPLSGFYGDGIAYRQFGRQQRITYTYRWIQRVHDLFSTPRAWVDPAGGVPVMQMSNEIGAVIQSRRKPEFQVQNSVPSEIYKWLDSLEHGGFEDEGMQYSAANQLPPGVDSAPAQREYNFKEGQRFAPVSQRWENAVGVETAVKMVAMYRRHAMTHKAPVVRWADRRLVHQIEWPDLDEDAYEIQASPSSLESLSPAARTQSALEMAQTGWIDMKEGRALLRHPDLDRSNDLDTSGEQYAEWVLRQLYRGEQVPVDEFADFESLQRVVKNGYRLACIRGAPRDVRDCIAQYLDELDAMIQRATAAAMQPGGPGATGLNHATPPPAMAGGVGGAPEPFGSQ